MPRILLLLLIPFLYCPVKGQNAPELSDYTATFTHGNVLVNWTIKSGNTCNGARLFHSSDSVHYQLIHEVFGVCGNITEEEHYFFLHTQPGLNQSNYYRLELGTDQNFWITRLFVPLEAQNALNIWPSPARETVFAGWENPTYEMHLLRLMDAQGRILYESSTRESFFSTALNGYPSGIYYMTLQKEGERKIHFQKFAVY